MPRFDDVAVMALRRNPEARCRDRTKPINFSERQQAQVIEAFSEQPDTTARMVNTYRTADDADRDKAHLVELFEALNVSPSVLRRDDASPKPRASV